MCQNVEIFICDAILKSVAHNRKIFDRENPTMSSAGVCKSSAIMKLKKKFIIKNLLLIIS